MFDWLINPAPFPRNIEIWVTGAIGVIAGFLAIAALLHCALQRPDAFPAAGPLTKGTWLLLLGGTLLLSTLGVFGGGAFSLFGIIGLIASLVYLLDIRPALRSGGDAW
ncbi:DUF2516 family protein [Stackebrandtia soli]|uniref:DUF2516 family protein n=1 Tax=Stackebrandtia soli TaxID=1892856 RepID=UPI0039EB1D43